MKKLTPEQIEEIKRMLAERKISHRKIAYHFGFFSPTSLFYNIDPSFRQKVKDRVAIYRQKRREQRIKNRSNDDLQKNDGQQAD